MNEELLDRELTWICLGLSGAPTIVVEPVNTVVDAGTTVVLNCQAEGEPTPVIEWSRQGRPLLGSDHFSTLNNGSLRVSSVQQEDTAEYECVARNLLGSVLVRIALTVQGELHIFPVSLSISIDLFSSIKEKESKLNIHPCLISSSWGPLRVGGVGTMQCNLWGRVPQEAEAV